MNAPEVPYALTGAIALLAGFIREKGWPKEGYKATLAEFLLVTMASATRGTKIAPIVATVGWIHFMAVVYALANKKG